MEFHQTNFFGHLRVLHRAIEHMDSSGIIFDWGSLTAEVPPLLRGPYAVGKRAQHAYADTWNIENSYLAQYGVTPNPKIVIVEPIFANTTFTQFDWAKPRTLPQSNPLVGFSREFDRILLSNGLAPEGLIPDCSFVIGNAVTYLAGQPSSSIPGRIVPISNPFNPPTNFLLLDFFGLNVANAAYALPEDDLIDFICETTAIEFPPPTPDNYKFGTSQTHGDQSVHHVKCYSEDSDHDHSCKTKKLPQPPFPLQKTNTVSNVPKCTGKGLKLKGRNILVIGASRGIGREIAERLGKDGANVIGTSRNPSKCKPSKYFTFADTPLDIRFQYSVDEFFDAAVKPLKHIDALINVAGIQSFGPIGDYYADDIVEVWQTNLYGFHRTLRAVLPYTNLDTKLINIGCEYGSEIPGVVGQGAYATTKRALQHYATCWNLDNCNLANNTFDNEPVPYPYAPKLILIEPTITSTDLGNFEYAKPETLNTFSPFVQKPRENFIKAMDKCGASAREIGLAVLEVVRTPSADVKTRYLVNRKHNCFDKTTQELIDAELTLPINETNVILNQYYSR